tara:strand:+ start:786 stop:977 length:192 start_codon:yes stop_codon:yes gene_type:complete
VKYICTVELEIKDNLDKSIYELESSFSEVVNQWAEDNEICGEDTPIDTSKLWCGNFYKQGESK